MSATTRFFHLRQSLTWRAGLVLFTLSMLTLGATDSPAVAHFETSRYTKKSDCQTEVDPINVVFHGPRGDWRNAANHVEHHTGWSDRGGSAQANISHSDCLWMATERASATPQHSRNHIRFFWAGDDAPYAYYSAGDAHHEIVTECGHAVDPNGADGSGFDQARRRLESAMDCCHRTSTVNVGNTRNFWQCNSPVAIPNGWWAGSNGYVATVQIGGK